MRLREHPLMNCMTRRAWPPSQWKSVGGQQDVFLTGEIGILKEIRIATSSPRMTKLYLLIEVEKRLYMGISLIEDSAFARQVYELLEEHLDEPIASVGDLDVGHLL
ncbi:MAG TPA: hypothetical protein VGH16_18530 [Candidatus Binatia bacterium]|jgi:hypothetical protein